MLVCKQSRLAWREISGAAPGIRNGDSPCRTGLIPGSSPTVENGTFQAQRPVGLRLLFSNDDR
jgi:hypothetical protein